MFCLLHHPVSGPPPEDGEVVGAAPHRGLQPHHLQAHRLHHLQQLLLVSRLRSDKGDGLPLHCTVVPQNSEKLLNMSANLNSLCVLVVNLI